MRLPCLVLAGGLGTRMRPSTDCIPKSLLPIAGKPFVHWQLSWLASQGIERVIFSIGHLGEQIEIAVGDGGAWGLSVEYVRDGQHLLGTGGAVRQAIDSTSLPAFLVLYGDSYLQASIPQVEAAFHAAGRPALMTVWHNQGRWDASNAHYADGRVTRYGKGKYADADMAYVDYGLLVFEAGAITERVGTGQKADLADVCTDLSLHGLLAGFEVTECFYEIGSKGGLTDLRRFLGDPAQGPSRRNDA